MGRTLSEETRTKISEALSGTRNPNYGGKTMTAEARAKLSASLKGRSKSPETIEKIAAARRGTTVSEESRRKMSLAKKGIPKSPETRARMSAAKKGKCLSARNRAALSAAKKGKPSGREGNKCHFWKGGVSFEPHCPKFNRDFKERVREFFGRACVECGAPENGKRLAVHHVNFRKDSCCSDDAEPLFVALCQSCHAKTNFNREYWEARFTALIRERYGGRCYLPKKESV